MPKKKEGNGGLPTAGQNSTLTDEEKRALTLHHKRAYETADALVEAAKADRTAIADLAKSDLGKGALADHNEEGKTAGMSGATCEPPKNLAHDASQKWIAGWHEGQTVLMSAFKKKRPIDAPDVDPSQIDLKDRPDLQAAGTA